MLFSFIYALSHALDRLDNALEERNVGFKVSGRDTVYTSPQSEGDHMKENLRNDLKKRGPQLERTRKRSSGRFLVKRKISFKFSGQDTVHMARSKRGSRSERM